MLKATRTQHLPRCLSRLPPKTAMVARATYSSFFFKIENIILKFQKNLKLNLYVDNVVIYNHENFQIKIPYILSSTKITNSDICNSEQCRFSKSHNLSEFIIFVQPRILEILSSNFCTLVDPIIVYIWIFFSNFFKILKYYF
jgi:hypothetical protein